MAYEGRASEIASASHRGVSCRVTVRRPMWQPIGYPAAPTHPPHAIGTRGPLGDQITSIEASFDFSVQRSLKYPHVRPQARGTLVRFSVWRPCGCPCGCRRQFAVRVGVRAPKRPSATFFLRAGAKLAVNDARKSKPPRDTSLSVLSPPLPRSRNE